MLNLPELPAYCPVTLILAREEIIQRQRALGSSGHTRGYPVKDNNIVCRAQTSWFANISHSYILTLGERPSLIERN